MVKNIGKIKKLMTSKIHISSKDMKSAQVTSDNFAAEITPDYCLVELGKYTFKITPEYYRSLEIVCELAKQLNEIGEL